MTTTATIKRLKLTKLKLDDKVFPRAKVDGYHVRAIAKALEAEAHLPPIIVEAKTFRVVDGWHRIAAFRRVWGDDALIDAEVREYEDDAAFFADAVKANVAHGRGLTPYDKAVCIAKADGLQMVPDAVAGVLNMTQERYEGMRTERFAHYAM